MQAGARDNDNGSLPAGFVSLLAEKSGFFFSSSLGLDDSMLCYQTRGGCHAVVATFVRGRTCQSPFRAAFLPAG